MIFKNTNEGEIRFLQSVNGTGDHLNDDNESAIINISANFVSVRSDLSTGFNKSANITIYNTNALVGVVDKLPYRNGAVCAANICTELVDADTYIFNVTGFTNYSAGVSNQAPIVVNISDISAQIVTENNIAYVNFTVLASDANGYTDLNNLTLNASFYFGSVRRINESCAFANNVNATTNNYTCSIGIWYWDSPGSWNVNATIKDSSGIVSDQYGETFTISGLIAGNMTPETLTWPALNTSSTNVSANENLTLKNTGNINISMINITAHDLVGQTVPSFSIYAANFTTNFTSILESNTNACTTDAGTWMANNTNVTVAGSSVPSGNNSNNQGIGKIKLCIKNINIIAQNYTTATYGLWDMYWG